MGRDGATGNGSGIGDVEVSLPWPPPPLWPNNSRGRSWKVRKATEDAYKIRAAVAANGLSAPKANKARITFHKPNRARFDLDNAYAAMKPAQDVICAKLGLDDSQLQEVTLVRGEPWKAGGILVEFSAPSE